MEPTFARTILFCLIITEFAAKVCDRCGTSFVLHGHYRENRVIFRLKTRRTRCEMQNLSLQCAMEGSRWTLTWKGSVQILQKFRSDPCAAPAVPSCIIHFTLHRPTYVLLRRTRMSVRRPCRFGYENLQDYFTS